MKDDKYIRDIFKGIDEDIQLDLERPILLQIKKEKEHSEVINWDQKLSKIGLWTSISLAIIVTAIYLLPLFSNANISKDDSLLNLLPTVYSVLILLILYIQIEVFKSSRFVSKNKALQN